MNTRPLVNGDFPLITDWHFCIVAIPAVLLLGVSKSGFGAGFGLLAVPVMVRLREAANQAMARLSAQGLELRSMNPNELAAFGRTEISRWSELVKRSGAQID